MAAYYFDSQIKRFLLQFAKIFSLWEVSEGVDSKGNTVVRRVPVMYGDMSRNVASIIADNTTSNLPSTPMITYYITGIEYDQRRMQSPTYVDKVQVRQRVYNSDTQSYESTQGQAYTVERMMPAPYILRVQADIWTSNAQQKQELFEQIGPIFNPCLEIQNTDNYLDWTSLSAVFQDGITYSSRSVPQGTTNNIDILSWKFYMPIWLTLPARIQKMGIIQKIVNSIHKGSMLEDIQDDDLLLGTRQKLTPYGYKLLLLGNKLQVLPNDTPFYLPNSDLRLPESPDTDIYWHSFLNEYGAVRPGISQIWLQNPYNDSEIIGTIDFDPVDDRLLIYNIDTDTLPQNTLQPINGVINPLIVGPNSGLPGPVNQRRYLLVEAVGAANNTTIAWGDLIANANDIIEYNANTNKWTVSFDSQNATSVEYVLNLNTNVQYRFTDGEWMKSFEGWYEEGNYSIVI